MDNTQKTSSLKFNFLFNLIIQLLNVAIPIVTAPYLSRVLTSEGIGSNSYIVSIVNYFSAIISFGSIGYGTRLISINRNDKDNLSKSFWSVFCAKSLLSLLAVSVFLLIIGLNILTNGIDRSLFFAYLPLLIGTWLDLTFAFQGLEKFKQLSVITIIVKLIGLLLIFLFVNSKSDLLIYILIYSIQTFLIALISWLFFLKNIGFAKVSFHDVLCVLKSSLPFFLPSLAVSVSSLIDKTMIGLLLSNESLGLYEEASKIVNLVNSIVAALAPVLLSRISFLIKEKEMGEVKKKIGQLFEVYALIVFPAFAGLLTLGYSIIPTYFGQEYIGSVEILYILVVSVLFTPLNVLLGNAYYAPMDKMWLSTVFYCVGTLTNIGLNAWLIRVMGTDGAALATVISEFIMLILFLFFAREALHSKLILKGFLKPLISTLIMTGFLLLYRFLLQGLAFEATYLFSIVGVLLGVVSYGICLIILREEMVFGILKSMLSKIHKQRQR